MYVEKRTKSPIFTPPVHLTPPMKGFPLEFGIGVRGPKCLNDGSTRWSKKFSDRFSRFDTIPAVTDSQPASHVAVAITLNAKASSLKMQTVTVQSCTNKSGRDRVALNSRLLQGRVRVKKACALRDWVTDIASQTHTAQPATARQALRSSQCLTTVAGCAVYFLCR